VADDAVRALELDGVDTHPLRRTLPLGVIGRPLAGLALGDQLERLEVLVPFALVPRIRGEVEDDLRYGVDDHGVGEDGHD